jgi:hypothetical protein
LNTNKISSPGQARRQIYLPAFRNLIEHWLNTSETVRQFVCFACEHDGDVYLRDFDTGRGIDRNGPMSHAWLFAEFLNNDGVWPDGVASELPPGVRKALTGIHPAKTVS